MHSEKVFMFSCCKGSSLVHLQYEEHEMAGGSLHAKSTNFELIKEVSERSSAVSIVNRVLSGHLVYFPQFEMQPCQICPITTTVLLCRQYCCKVWQQPLKWTQHHAQLAQL